MGADEVKKPRTTVEIAPGVDRRMHGKSGSVTLHYKDGKVYTVQWGDREDADDLVDYGDNLKRAS